MISAAFTQTLSPERWKELRWRFFRLHFQYLCAFDRPGDYDYFQITAGPLTLGEPLCRAARLQSADRRAGVEIHIGGAHDRRPNRPRAPDQVSLWRYARLFRADILSAQPARLYRAWMAEFRTPFFRRSCATSPTWCELVLKERPDDFPKSDRIGEGLRAAAGQFGVSDQWRDLGSASAASSTRPSRAGGCATPFRRCWAAGQAAVARLDAQGDGDRSRSRPRPAMRRRM